MPIINRPCHVAIVFFVWAVTAFAEEKTPPNVIVMLVDDLGCHDLGCQGSTCYQTPHIDRLAQEGMRFTTAYSACTVCSPTRAALLTGRYPARLHVTDWIAGHVQPRARLSAPDWTQHLPLEEITLAEKLRDAGYLCSHIGKWHLGGPEFYPEKHGFAVNIGGTDKGQPPSYFSPYKISTLSDGPAGESLTDREMTEAIKCIDAAQVEHKPFFLYLPRYVVHTPLQAQPELIAKYKTLGDAQPPNPTYAAMIENLDQSVGKLLEALKTRQLDQRTLIVFTSDNGGLLPITNNAPLRAGKGSAYEGGVRVPLMFRWPGTISPGVCAVPAMTIDLLPTILELVNPASPTPTDGISLAPWIKSPAEKPPERSLYWHYPHYHPGGATPYSAVRAGEWRLLEFFEDGQQELYNLQDDPTESHDLANQNPDKRNELASQLAQWRIQVGAQFPSVNPQWDGKMRR